MKTEFEDRTETGGRRRLPRQTGVFLAAILSLNMTAFSQVTVLWVNCGGEDERPCAQSEPNKGWGLLPANTPSDNWNNNGDQLRCDKGLQIHSTANNTLRCVNRNRLTVGETDSSITSPWLWFARNNQFGSIQADQPLTFAPIIGTHNSYSNYFDGATSQLSTDQGFSITDQLQYGARILRLDPWYFTNTDYQAKLCHSGADFVGGDDDTGGTRLCDRYDELGQRVSLDRSFVFAIKEIAHWLRLHPGEFIILRLHDQAQGWGSSSDTINGLVSTVGSGVQSVTMSTQAYFAPAVAHELGDMVYKNPIYSADTGNIQAAPLDYRFPSLRQLRAMRKQVLIVTEFPNEWAFEDANGQNGPLGLGAIQTKADTYSGLTCTDGFGILGALHTPGAWAEVGEDRSLSVPDQSKMLDAPRLKQGLKCGYNVFSLDFFGTLNQAPNPQLLLDSISPMIGFLSGFGVTLQPLNFQCNDFSASTCDHTDQRREASIWSWQPNQGAGGQPVQMINLTGDSFGSWFSAQASLTAPYLCAGPLSGNQFPDGSLPDFKAWYLTKAAGAWNGGETACQAEKGSGWHFWHPMSALQNNAAFNTLVQGGKPSAWINHYQGPVRALPESLSFTVDRSAVSVSQSLVVTGGFGGKLTVTSSNSAIDVSVVPLYSALNASQKADKTNNNDSNLYTVSISRIGAILMTGTYYFTLTVREDSVSTILNPGQPPFTQQRTDYFSVPVTVTVLPSYTITSNPPGFNVVVDGVSYATPHTFVWTPGSVHSVDAGHPGALPSDTHIFFHDWSDGLAVSHNVTTASADTTLTATYSLFYLLTLHADGHGTVSVAAPTLDSYYPAGSSVQIIAAPQTHSYFAKFDGDLSGTTNPQMLTMSHARTVTAVFKDDAVVHVPANSFGIAVTTEDGTYSTPHDFYWIPGSSHTLSFPPATPLTPGKQVAFQKWSDGTMNSSRTITPEDGKTFTPVFVVQWLVTTSVNPASAGQVTGGGWQNDGSSVQFTATPNAGYSFGSFSGDLQSTTSPKTVNISGPMNVTANFSAAGGSPNITIAASMADDSDPKSVQLTVTVKNTGTGAASNVNIALYPYGANNSGLVTAPAVAPIALMPGNTSTSVPVTLSWPSSVPAIQLVVRFSANSGAVTGAQVFTLTR